MLYHWASDDGKHTTLGLKLQLQNGKIQTQELGITSQEFYQWTTNDGHQCSS